jgi:hypothetical protein
MHCFWHSKTTLWDAVVLEHALLLVFKNNEWGIQKQRMQTPFVAPPQMHASFPGGLLKKDRSTRRGNEGEEGKVRGRKEERGKEGWQEILRNGRCKIDGIWTVEGLYGGGGGGK